MANTEYFMDIERFVQWTYFNAKYFTEEGSQQKFGSTTVKEWRNYKKLPSKSSIEEINNLLLPNEDSFSLINIAELMICINNAKDHNRGNTKDIPSITSTGKKVLTLLLFGRHLDDNNHNYFKATNSHNTLVYNYLTSFNNSKKKISSFYYLPGRTISFEQLCCVGHDYTNSITQSGINLGLSQLTKIQLVSCVDPQKYLYKLNFDQCLSYYNKCKL